MYQDVRTICYLIKADRIALDKISKETGSSVSELVRRAVKQWLKQRNG